MSVIISIKDLLDLREAKQRELEFYSKKLDELNRKLFFLNKEIELTNYIMHLIEKEKILDLRNLVNDSSNTKSE